MFKGKLFLVLLTAFLVTGNASASGPGYAVVHLEGEDPDVMVLDTVYPLAGLDPGLNFGWEFNSYFGGAKGYVDIIGDKTVILTNIYNDLVIPPIVANAGIQDYESGSTFSVFGPVSWSGSYDYVGMLDMVLLTSTSDYSFSNFILSGGLPSVVAKWLIIPDRDDPMHSFTSIFDVQVTPDINRQWVFTAKVVDSISPVPEPSTYAMLLLGVLFLGLFSRSRLVARHDPGGATV
ncbi:MAG: PEP-CTERM motif protein [Parcubacteria bacterium OLB19]|nr:MAG: PEP-CTERM motif protein [Parcubacteria bacterium OLB19]